MRDDEHQRRTAAVVEVARGDLADGLVRMGNKDLKRKLDALSRERRRLQRQLDGLPYPSDVLEESQALLTWNVVIARLIDEELTLREGHGATRITGS